MKFGTRSERLISHNTLIRQGWGFLSLYPVERDVQPLTLLALTIFMRVAQKGTCQPKNGSKSVEYVIYFYTERLTVGNNYTK